MRKKKKELQLEEEQNQINRTEEVEFLKKRTIKELIAPAGIDASKIDHLEIISNVKKYARSFLYQHYHVCVLFQNYLGIYTFLEI